MKQSVKEICKGIIAGVITVTGVVVFTFVLINSQRSSSEDTDDALGNVNYDASVEGQIDRSNVEGLTIEGLPKRLKIPEINVDANIQHVGVSARGNMAVPTNYSDVGWFRRGPRPGEGGTSVINGHLDNGFGLKAVFWDLPKLQKGNEIIVETDAGERVTFTVTEAKVVAYDDPNAARFVLQKEEVPTLRLITCSGNWNSVEKTYEERLIITAELSGPKEKII